MIKSPPLQQDDTTLVALISKLASVLEPMQVQQRYLSNTLTTVLVSMLILICIGIGVLSWVFVQVESDSHLLNSAYQRGIQSQDESLTSTEVVRLNEPYMGVWDVSNAIKQRALFWKGANLLEHLQVTDYDEIIDFYGTESMFSPELIQDDNGSDYQIDEPQEQNQNQEHDLTILTKDLDLPEQEDFLDVNSDDPFVDFPSSPNPFVVVASEYHQNSIFDAQNSPQPNHYPSPLPQVNSFSYSNKIAQMIEEYIAGKSDDPATKLLPPVTDLKDFVRYGSNNLNSYLSNKYSLTFPKYDESHISKPDLGNFNFLDSARLFDDHDLKKFHMNEILIDVKTFRYFMGLERIHDKFLAHVLGNSLFLFQLIMDDEINEEVKVTIFKIVSDSFTDMSSIEITVNFTYTIILGLLKRLAKINDKTSMEYQFGIITSVRIVNTLSVEDFNEFVLDDMFNHILSYFPQGVFDNFIKINEFYINKVMETYMEVLKIDLLMRCKCMLDINDLNGFVQFVKTIHDNIQVICNSYSFLNAKSIELLFTWIWMKTKRNQVKTQIMESTGVERKNSMNVNKYKLKLDENYHEYKNIKFQKGSIESHPLANNIAIMNLNQRNVKSG